MRFGNKLGLVLLGSVALVGPAMAGGGGGPDVSAATGGLTQVVTAVGEIGPLMLSAVGAGIVFKWVLAFII